MTTESSSRHPANPREALQRSIAWYLRQLSRLMSVLSDEELERLIPLLTERRFKPRQVLFSTDLIYDVLRKHQPDHVLLRAARADAATGLLDIRRLSDMLTRIKGRITHRELKRISPLAVPVMLEIGREAVYGEASDELLAEAAEELVKEAMS